MARCVSGGYQMRCCWKLTAAMLVSMLLVKCVGGQNYWDREGCHLLGFTETVMIPGCVSFDARTNACRGYCLSYAHPSPTPTLRKNPRHVITSRSECCSIDETHDVSYVVRCLTGYREFIFKSAATCACSVCQVG